MKTPQIAQPVREDGEINVVITPEAEAPKVPEAPKVDSVPDVPANPGDAPVVESKPTDPQDESQSAEEDEEVESVIGAKRIPSNWSIKPLGSSDKIVAVCFVDGDTFEGTIEAFNKMLRG